MGNDRGTARIGGGLGRLLGFGLKTFVLDPFLRDRENKAAMAQRGKELEQTEKLVTIPKEKRAAAEVVKTERASGRFLTDVLGMDLGDEPLGELEGRATEKALTGTLPEEQARRVPKDALKELMKFKIEGDAAGTTAADKLKFLNARLDAERKIRELPAKGVAKTGQELTIQQGQGIEGPPSIDREAYQAELNQVLAGSLGGVTEAPATLPQVRGEVPRAVTPAAQPLGVLSSQQPRAGIGKNAASLDALEDFNKRKATTQAIVNANAKQLILIGTAKTSMQTIWDLSDKVFTGQPGYINRLFDYAKVKGMRFTQYGNRAEAIALFDSKVDASATALAKLHGELRVSDYDAVRYKRLNPSLGEGMFGLPDSDVVAALKVKSMKEMMAWSESNALAALTMSTSDWITKAEENLKRNMLAADLDPFEGKKPNSDVIYTSPKDVLDAYTPKQ